MAWFRKDKKPLTAQDRRDVPTDVFDKCPGCGEIMYRERLAQNLNVCPACGHHMRISAEAYLSVLLDRGTFEEMDEDLRAADPLEFRDSKAYPDRIAAAEAKGKREAVVSGTGRLDAIQRARADAARPAEVRRRELDLEAQLGAPVVRGRDGLRLGETGPVLRVSKVTQQPLRRAGMMRGEGESRFVGAPRLCAVAGLVVQRRRLEKRSEPLRPRPLVRRLGQR